MELPDYARVSISAVRLLPQRFGHDENQRAMEIEGQRSKFLL
jgi:hypothetical protein